MTVARVQIYSKGNFTRKNSEHKSTLPQIVILYPARLGLRMIFYWIGISLGMFFDDLHKQIGKITYHYLKKNLRSEYFNV